MIMPSLSRIMKEFVDMVRWKNVSSLSLIENVMDILKLKNPIVLSIFAGFQLDK